MIGDEFIKKVSRFRFLLTRKVKGFFTLDSNLKLERLELFSPNKLFVANPISSPKVKSLYY